LVEDNSEGKNQYCNSFIKLSTKERKRIEVTGGGGERKNLCREAERPKMKKMGCTGN